MRRQGFVLVLTLVALVLVEAVVLGAIAIAHADRSAANVQARVLDARLQAESAVRAAIAHWPTLHADSLSAGTVRTHIPDGQGGATVDIEALGNGRFLLRGRARAAAGGRVFAHAMVHTLPLDSLEGLFRAAVTAAGPVAVGAPAVVDGLNIGAACAATDVVPALLTPPAALAVEPGATLEGSPPTSESEELGTTAPALDLLVGFAEGADELEGSLRPAPVSDGAHCFAAEDNWGDPDGATPCADHFPLLFAPGDLHVAGGSGQGVLFVNGILRMDGDARFSGAIIARRLELGEARIEGAVRITGSDTSRIAGLVRFDPCALRRALSAPDLRRPFRRGDRLWLPAH